jgi:hypothetical protein
VSSFKAADPRAPESHESYDGPNSPADFRRNEPLAVRFGGVDVCVSRIRPPALLPERSMAPKSGYYLTLFALLAIVVAQAIVWYADRRINPGLILMFTLLVVLTFTSKKRAKGREKDRV